MSYEYDKPTVNVWQISDEIKGGIGLTAKLVSQIGIKLRINFDRELTSSEKSALDTIVQNHVSNPNYEVEMDARANKWVSVEGELIPAQISLLDIPNRRVDVRASFGGIVVTRTCDYFTDRVVQAVVQGRIAVNDIVLVSVFKGKVVVIDKIIER